MANPERDVKVLVGKSLRCDVSIRGHRLVADEPEDRGGGDEGPTPAELFLAGLSACTAMTLRMYADNKGWPLKGVEVAAEQAWVTPEEWADWPEGEERKRIPRIVLTIRAVGDLTDEQIERLHYIARRCPVHRVVSENPATVHEVLRTD